MLIGILRYILHRKVRYIFSLSETLEKAYSKTLVHWTVSHLWVT